LKKIIKRSFWVIFICYNLPGGALEEFLES
jgi:hypothetical protein